MTIIGSAQDVYHAKGDASFVVNVVSIEGFNMSAYLDYSLKKNFATGNIDGVIQTVNFVSSIVSSKNCSAAPNCAGINRSGCLETSNTCGICLSGYEGIIGDSNTKCARESSPIGTIGSVCKQDEDCLYRQCENRLCTAPQQTCQTSVPGTICSGHGICRNLDSSGNNLQNCTIVSHLCSASCLCHAGHGGVDCSLNTAALRERSKVRGTICTALNRVISVSQKSPQLFDSIAGSLLSAYDDTEISSTSELAKCSSIVRFLGTLSSRGFLKGTLPATQQIYAEISSQFVGTRVSPSSVGAYQFADDVGTAVKGMTEGIIKGMVEGQNPVSVVTKNIRATIINELVSSLSNAHFSPPSTFAETKYGAVQPKIIITGDGVSSCSRGSPYAQISTLQFGTNPHLGSDTLRSSLLQFSSTVTTKSPKIVKSNRRVLLPGSFSSPKNETLPAYYVILQYSSEQKLNLSIQAGPYSRNSNVTIPICTLYDATIGKYVDCADCKISSYTNFNATFACYNIKNLCPSDTKTGRRRSLNAMTIEDTTIDDVDEGYENVSREVDMQIESASGSNDEYTPSADDVPSGSDDRFDSNRRASVSEFGTVISAIGAELASVLSLNPFAIDLNKAIPVLALVGGLCGSIIIGLLCFLRWDKMDRHKAVYLLDEKERKVRNQIADNLKRGGNGVTSTRHSSKKSDNRTNDSFINIFNASMESIASSSDNGKSDRKTIFDRSFRSTSSPSDYPESKDDNTFDDSFEKKILTAKFSNEVLPKTYTFYEGALELKRGKYKFKSSTWTDAAYTIRHRHYFTAMLYRSSLCVSRTLRYLEMCRKVLLYIFIDTVIYGVYFPSDATCTTYVSKAECLSLPSKVRQIMRNYYLLS